MEQYIGNWSNDSLESSLKFTMEKMDQYWTTILLWRKRINIGHLFYYRETDQYCTPTLLWRKRINIGHLFYYGENGSILDTYFTMEKTYKQLEEEVI